jgi:hypothetical protein
MDECRGQRDAAAQPDDQHVTRGRVKEERQMGESLLREHVREFEASTFPSIAKERRTRATNTTITSRATYL